MILRSVCFALTHASDSDEGQALLNDARSILPAIPGVVESTASRQIGEQSDHRFQVAMRLAGRDADAGCASPPDHQGSVAERWKAEVAAFQVFDVVRLEARGMTPL